MKQLLWVMMVFLVTGCGWNVTCAKYFNTYTIGQEKTVTVGSEMVQTGGCILAHYEPTGFNETLWNRQPCDQELGYPGIDSELLYSGREGDILHISYREYYTYRDYESGIARSIARTPFFQQVYYDLKKSDSIMFQDWIIQVLSADNQKIRFKVLKESPPIPYP